MKPLSQDAFVSVVIPVFNDEDRIRIVIEALLSQSLPREQFEVIIVDNGSTDGTAKVIEEYAGKYPGVIRLEREDKIQSSYAARNRGIEVARGALLAFTDSDCVPQPEWLSAGLSGLVRSGAICGGGAIEFFYRSKKPNIYELSDSLTKLNQQHYVEEIGFAATANFFARRELFEQHGVFQASLISGGDFEFGRRLTSEGVKMIYIADAKILHPARASFGEILKKSVRVAEGEKVLAASGRLPHAPISLRRCLPLLRLPIAHEVLKQLTFRQRVGLLLVSNVFRYVNLWLRLR
ncbi:MAG: glycosyltransferase [Verrucomicrobia bacterium]|nr:glycosyltransferase [Verrucomicrobiota bacterium]